MTKLTEEELNLVASCRFGGGLATMGLLRIIDRLTAQGGDTEGGDRPYIPPVGPYGATGYNTPLSPTPRAEAAPMGVDREAFWDIVANALDNKAQFYVTHEGAGRIRVENAAEVANDIYNNLASGIVGKALPSEEELARIMFDDAAERQQHGVSWEGATDAARNNWRSAARAVLNHIKGNAA